MSNSEIYDITIIGGGPTGLFASFYAGMRGAKTKIIEALGQLGGQLAAIYPEKDIYDVPGFPKVVAKELVQELEKQGLQFDPEVCLEERVKDITRDDEGIITLKTTKGDHRSRTILLTAGMGAFSPRKLGNPEVERFEGKGLVYTVRELNNFRNQRVLIVGGGDSAVDWALTLEPIAESVTLIHRRDKFRAHQSSAERLLNSGVNIMFVHELRTLHGDDHVEEAVVFHNKTDEETVLPIDLCVLSLGFSADTETFDQWGLNTDNGLVVVDNFKMETSRPGIFAAGDIVTYDGKIKLIATGFGEAANAVNAAYIIANPDAKYNPGHSSSRKDLGQGEKVPTTARS